MLEDLEDNYTIDPSLIKKAKVYIKIPTWVETHEINRLSSKKDPYLRTFSIDESKNKDIKLKLLCLKIEDDEGNVYNVDDDFVDNMHPELAVFLMKEITNESLDLGAYDSVTKEEERKLAYECYCYFSAIEKEERGINAITIPIPPAIIIVRAVCEMLGCTPEQARSISKKDIDSLFIANEQATNCQDPRVIGMAGQK